MTTTQELEALLQGCTPAPWSCGERADKSMWLSIGQSSGAGAHYQFNFDGHYYADAQLIALAPTLAAELIKERANSSRLLSALRLSIMEDGSVSRPAQRFVAMAAIQAAEVAP